MTLLGKALEKIATLHSAATGKALALAEELLAPAGPIPRAAVERLLRRALRNGGWRLLTREQQALLYAAAHAEAKVYRAPLLLSLLRAIWVRVEQATARGKAVVAALAHLAARGTALPVSAARRMLGRLVALGLQLLHHPILGMSSA